jgi:apolipoprotein D and lipocalin family protein
MKTLMLLVLLLPLQNAYSGKKHNLPTVSNVDIQNYLGKWYEISSFPQDFQKGCTATTAEYSLRKDGDIRVINRCRLDNPNGILKEAVGRAWIKDKKTNAKLKVQFFLREFKFPFFSGNYWILDLDNNYESVLIGEPKRKYLWILSRSPYMDNQRYKELVQKAKELNFDISKLKRTIHN